MEDATPIERVAAALAEIAAHPDCGWILEAVEDEDPEAWARIARTLEGLGWLEQALLPHETS